MAQDGKISERERARVARQAATLRANLLKRKAQQRARRTGPASAAPTENPTETGDESAMLSESRSGNVDSADGNGSRSQKS